MPEQTEYCYLLRLQFLGFRYHGWQKQPGVKTVEGMLRKTLRFVLPGIRVRLLGAGRTDAMVSAHDFALQLCTESALPGVPGRFLEQLNENLPPDIRVKGILPAPAGFNAIRDCQGKTYHYYFCFGPKPHPFCAPYLGYFQGQLDMRSMGSAALLLKGTHDFGAFTAHPAPGSRRIRTLDASDIGENHDLTASFFPEETYRLRIRGAGFGRNQVRLLMAALVAIGRGEADHGHLMRSLAGSAAWPVGSIAPASGLHLIRAEFAGDGL